MQLMLTNMGNVPLPVATSDAGGFAQMLPPGLRVPFVYENATNLVFGFKPKAPDLGVKGASDELIEEYKTYGEAWLGRDDVPEGTEMAVDVLVENFEGDLTITTEFGTETIAAGASLRIAGSLYAEATGGSATPPDPIDPPDPGDVTGTISSFTAASPTTVTMDTQDEAMIEVGGTMTLEALTGDPDAMAFINGKVATVVSKAPVTLDLDLTTYNVTALTADFLLPAPPAGNGAPAPAPAPTAPGGGLTPSVPPAPAPAPAPSITIQITAFGASNPGLAGVAQSDGQQVHVGDILTLTQVGGTPGTIPAGQQATITAIDGGMTTLTLSMDTSTYNVDGLTANAVVTPGATGAPAPAPAPASPPPWIIRNITQINPVVGTVDDITGLNQGDYLTFTVVEGTQAQKDALNGQGGQVQSLNGMTVQIGYNGSAAGDATGIVLSGAK